MSPFYSWLSPLATCGLWSEFQTEYGVSNNMLLFQEMLADQHSMEGAFFPELHQPSYQEGECANVLRQSRGFSHPCASTPN